MLIGDYPGFLADPGYMVLTMQCVLMSVGVLTLNCLLKLPQTAAMPRLLQRSMVLAKGWAL